MAKIFTFTDKYIQSLQPKDKPYRVVEARGFCVRVLSSGTKSFGYRFTLGGKKQELSLGVYPEVSLKTAREKYTTAYTKHQNGIDPRYVEPAPTPPENNTFKHFSDLYLIWSKKHHSSAWNKIIDLALKNDVLPFWKDKDITTIGRRDAIALLETVAKRSAGMVGNVHKAAQGVFDYALEREHLEYNPMLRLSKPVPDLKRPSRDRVLTDDEIKHVWKSLDDTPTNRALKLILVTAQRPGEVAGLHTQEMQSGVSKPICKTCRGCNNIWTIPKERAEKGKGDHLVYLTATAVELTRGIEEDGLVFNVQRSTLSQHVSRRKKFFDLPRWTPHDLRRTARTRLAELRVPNEHAEAVINHAKPGMVGVYNKYEYWEEKKEALIKWETELLRIVS
jgi:integrase